MRLSWEGLELVREKTPHWSHTTLITLWLKLSETVWNCLKLSETAFTYLPLDLGHVGPRGHYGDVFQSHSQGWQLLVEVFLFSADNLWKQKSFMDKYSSLNLFWRSSSSTGNTRVHFLVKSQSVQLHKCKNVCGHLNAKISAQDEPQKICVLCKDCTVATLRCGGHSVQCAYCITALPWIQPHEMLLFLLWIPLFFWNKSV